MSLRMYCIFARESLDKMGGNRGKMVAQAGHAFLHAFWDAETRSNPHIRHAATKYRDSGLAIKVTLVVDTVEELKRFEMRYRLLTGVSLVTDAARTVFDGPTVTCLGLGPIDPEDIDHDLSSLKVLI